MAEEKRTPTERHSFARAMGHLHAGALHRALGVKEGETIPEDKLEEASNSSNSHIKKMAIMAKAMRGWKHGSK